MPSATKAPDLSKFLNTRQVAEMFGISQRAVQEAIKKGELTAQQVGYFYLIWSEDIPKSWHK